MEDKRAKRQAEIWRKQAAGARRSCVYRHIGLWRKLVNWATDYRPPS